MSHALKKDLPQTPYRPANKQNEKIIQPSEYTTYVRTTDKGVKNKGKQDPERHPSEEQMDHALEDSFPASDPPGHY